MLKRKRVVIVCFIEESEVIVFLLLVIASKVYFYLYTVCCASCNGANFGSYLLPTLIFNREEGFHQDATKQVILLVRVALPEAIWGFLMIASIASGKMNQSI